MISLYSNVSGTNSSSNMYLSKKADSKNVTFGTVSILNNVYHRSIPVYVEKSTNNGFSTLGQNIFANVISVTKAKLIDYIKYNLKSPEIKGTGIKGFFRAEGRTEISDKVYVWKTDNGKTAFLTEEEADKFSELLEKYKSKKGLDESLLDNYLANPMNIDEKQKDLYTKFDQEVNKTIINRAITKATKGKIKPPKTSSANLKKQVNTVDEQAKPAKKQVQPAKFFDIYTNADDRNNIKITSYEVNSKNVGINYLKQH